MRKDTCKGCTLNKYSKVTFHDKERKTKDILERVHSDVCGPFLTASKKKHRYYMIFFYEFSRKCWILFMQKKDQAFSKFYEFKALVKKDTGKNVKALRSDNDIEYLYKTSKGCTCVERYMQRVYIGEVYQGHLSREGKLSHDDP